MKSVLNSKRYLKYCPDYLVCLIEKTVVEIV